MKRKLVLIISLIQLVNLPCLFAVQQGESYGCALLLAQESQERVDSEVVDILGEIVQQVVQRDKEKKHTLFFDAIKMNNENIFENLIHDSDLNINEEDEYGRTPLHLAAYTGNIDIVKKLFADKRIEINKVDKKGRTPLFWATECSHADIIEEFLADKRIDINKADENDMAPLFWGESAGIVKMFLKHKKIDLSIVSKNNWNALFWAVYLGRSDVVKVFIEDGRIDVGKADSEGRTAFDIAKEKKFSNIIEILKQKQQSTLARLFGRIMKPFRSAGKKGIRILRRLGKLRRYMPKIGIIEKIRSFFKFKRRFAS